MLAVGLTRVGRGEDASETTVLRDERAANVMRDHVFENRIEPRTTIDGIRFRHVDIADEELIPRRQANLGIERPFQIPVREDADKHVTVQHRKVPDLVFNHQPVRMAHTVADIDRAGKGCHERRNGRNVVHTVC